MTILHSKKCDNCGTEFADKIGWRKYCEECTAKNIPHELWLKKNKDRIRLYNRDYARDYRMARAWGLNSHEFRFIQKHFEKQGMKEKTKEIIKKIKEEIKIAAKEKAIMKISRKYKKKEKENGKNTI